MNSNLCEKFFAVLADKNRLSIINLILEKDLTVGDISKKLGIEQSLLSHHLKILKDHGFVESKIEGKNRIYTVNKDTVRPLMDIMRSHMQQFCGFACEYKILEWSKSGPMESINHETEVVMEKIRILKKYSNKKLKSKKELIEVSKFFNNTMNTHFKAEEETLFKAMKERGEENIVKDLLYEHKIMREKFAKLEKAVQDYEDSPEKLKKITEDISAIIKSHILKEEEILIPKAKEILTKKEFVDLEKQAEMLEAL